MKNKNNKININNLRVGNKVTLYIKHVENKKKIQTFKGIIIAINKNGINSTFTIRKINNIYCVERIFRVYSPNIVNIKINHYSKVRKAKLYYLRYLSGKKAKLKNK